MEKNESPNKSEKTDNLTSNIKSKVSGFSNRLFNITKFVLGVCLLPFVYFTSAAFLNEFALVEKSLQNNFWSGVISLLIVYLFVWEPAIIYAKGQKILEAVFTFMKPLVRVAPYLLPIYTIILFAVYPIFTSNAKTKGPMALFVFLFGFTLALHLIFGAKSLRSKKEDFLKANYIFGFSFVYILNISLLAFFFSLVFDKFSFINFCNYFFQTTKGFFVALFRQLFL